MFKTYALLDVDHTLLDDSGALNRNIVNSLIKNSIKDVYLFADMRFQVANVDERRILIDQLTDLGLTVHGTLITPDLFWAAVDAGMSKEDVTLKFGKTISGNQFFTLEQQCFSFALAIHEKKHLSELKLDRAFKPANNLSTMLPGRPHPNALMLKHFLEYKPADCASCVIYEDNEDVIKGSIEISANSGVPVVGIQVKKEDFQGDAALQRYNNELCVLHAYHDQLNLMLNQARQLSPLSAPGAQVAESAVNYAKIVARQGWLNTDDQAIQIIQAQYFDKRGFKFFGYSSDDSLKLLSDLNKTQASLAKQLIVSGFLSEDKNKGKRLYDVLIEQQIRHARCQSDAQSQNELEDLIFQINQKYKVRFSSKDYEVWLTEDMIYLINQKYKQKRGFKLFGFSSEKSADLLKYLNDKNISLRNRQKSLQNYLSDEQCKEKRLHDIITEVKNMIPNSAVPSLRQEKA